MHGGARRLRSFLELSFGSNNKKTRGPSRPPCESRSSGDVGRGEGRLVFEEGALDRGRGGPGKLEGLGAQVARDPETDLLAINGEFTASLVLSRCQRTEGGEVHPAPPRPSNFGGSGRAAFRAPAPCQLVDVWNLDTCHPDRRPSRPATASPAGAWRPTASRCTIPTGRHPRRGTWPDPPAAPRMPAATAATVGPTTTPAARTWPRARSPRTQRGQ